MSSLMLLLVWLIFFMVLIKLLPILGTISGKKVKLMVLGLICLGYIFFSSRRRHTRSLCDWSSDVCSSDLGGHLQYFLGGVRAGNPVADLNVLLGSERSEERRVGKECRSRWSPYH